MFIIREDENGNEIEPPWGWLAVLIALAIFGAVMEYYGFP